MLKKQHVVQTKLRPQTRLGLRFHVKLESLLKSHVSYMLKEDYCTEF